MSLPIIHSDSRELTQMQQTWSALLNPILAEPQSSGIILKNISLISTAPNVINHLLSRTMQGWQIIDINAAVIPYRSAPFNATSLTLTVSAPCVVNLFVF